MPRVNKKKAFYWVDQTDYSSYCERQCIFQCAKCKNALICICTSYLTLRWLRNSSFKHWVVYVTSADPGSEQKCPYFSCQCLNWTQPVIKSRPEEHEKAASTHAARQLHPPGREVQRWISLTCGWKVDVQILRSPCEIPASGKEKLAYCMSACVRVSVCICVGWREPLQYVEEISSAPKLGFQWNRVCGIKATGADSLSRGKHTSQTALSQLPAGLSRESACPPAFRLSCGVYTTDQWLPIPQVSLLLCILSPSLRFVLENFHNLLQVVHTIQYQGIHRKNYSWFATYSRKKNN